jgi:hypothetical protein
MIACIPDSLTALTTLETNHFHSIVILRCRRIRLFSQVLPQDFHSNPRLHLQGFRFDLLAL